MITFIDTFEMFLFFKENLEKIKGQNNHDKTRPPYFSKGHIQF
jgi:hypothetical protein